MKYIAILFILMISTGFAQQENPFYHPDFNKMIEQYGKNELSFELPAKKTLDSLRSPHYIWTDGYRIQVVATSDKNKALDIKNELAAGLTDSVYVIRDQQLYRVQFGDYIDRIKAETMVDSMRKFGWPAAWIVSRKVKQFVSDSLNIKSTLTAGTYQPRTYWSIQLGAFSDEREAQKFIQEIKPKIEDAETIRINSFTKVVVGKYNNEEKARIRLQSIQQAGFKDAWLTEIFISE
ncbi:MAG: hypothetical protein Kow00108_21220 [Calditrichia bacterium]